MIHSLLWLPLAGAVGLLAIPARAHRASWLWTCLFLLAGVVNALLLVTGELPQEVQISWIPAIGAEYLLRLDGISALLCLMTSVVSCLAVVASPAMPRLFYAMILLLVTGCQGVFLSQDLLLFFLFFEAVLIPMYFLIGIWGGERRRYAALKFVIYTVLGSVALLAAFLILYFQHAAATGEYTFDLLRLEAPALAPGLERWVFWLMVLGFAIKIPMFPLHTWLPDAHTEAPTAGSVILASVMLKMGTYGLLRFALPLAPRVGGETVAMNLLGGLSLVAIIFGGLVSLAQKDIKRLIAYSSVSHLGFCTLGIFSLNSAGLSGSVLQQVNHGISTGMLFLIVGFLYERRQTRAIHEFGGLAKGMPHLAFVFAFAMLSSVGLPLLNGFVGEFTILRGAFEARPWWAAVAVIGIVIAAAYLLQVFARVMLGQVKLEQNQGLPDLNWREWLVVAPLMIWAIWIGVAPMSHFTLLSAPVEQILSRVRP